MEFVTLNNGVQMPVLGYGVYQTRDTERCVRDALEVGYRSIDTAQYYRNEDAVGRAIAGSGVSRGEIFVTTKLATTGYENARRAIGESLQRLRSDYIDLLLIHWPMGDDVGTYRAMVEAHQDGVARSIGLSNFFGDDFTEIADSSDVSPAVNQIETHVFQQQRSVRDLLARYGTQLESWGPFAEGMNNMFTNPVLTRVGEAHDKTAAQVALRFLIQDGVVVIPKSSHRERMQQNFDVFDFTLSDAEFDGVRALDTGKGLFGWY